MYSILKTEGRAKRAQLETVHGRAEELFARYEREKNVVAARYRAARGLAV